MTKRARLALKILSLCVSIIPPLAAVLMCFPVWLEQGSTKTVSGLCLLLICLCLIPFYRQIKEYFRSPSAVMIWLVICVAMTLIRNIMDQMLLVSYVALFSNALGSFIYNLSKGEHGDSKD